MQNNAYAGYPQKPVSAVWSKVRVQLKRYYAILNRFGWLLPLTVSLGICIAAWVVSQMPPDYQSEGHVLVGGSLQIKGEGAVYNEQMDNYYGTQAVLMQSLDVQKGALVRVQTLHPELHPEAVTLTVEQQAHASIFNLRVEAETPAYAKDYLNATMDEYIELKRKQRLQASDSTTLAIQDQLAHQEKEIEASDAEMHDFQEKNNFGFLEKQGNDAADYLAKKNRELADLKSEYNLLGMLDLEGNLDHQQSSATTEAQGGTNSDSTAPDSQQSLATNMGPLADYQKAKQELALLKSQQADLGKNLRPAHPTMVALNREIERQNNLIQTLRAESADALKTRRDALQVQIQNDQNDIAEWQAKALALSGSIAEFDRIKTKADRAKEEYERLLTSMSGVTVAKNTDQDQVMIMDRASDATSIKPGWVIIVISGGVGGLLVGLLILFCIDQMDDRISSFLELQTHFQEIILGQIPRENFKEDAALLRHNDDRLALLEAFRSLRSSLIFFPTEGERPKTLIITSALPNEGKTTLSANLAITLAFSGARTLVVDADMRRGKLSNLFGVTEGHGLSNILLSTLPWKEVMLQTTVDNLFLVPCGPPLKHPAEHLLGKVADNFLKEIYDQFDYVIFDSPPVTLLDDTLSIAPKIDGALVVVRFGVSSVRTTRRAIELLEQRQTNILGMICNDVHISESESNYGYYYRQTAEAYAKEVRASA